MKTYFALGAAALLAAVFVFAPQSFADCSPGTPGCPQPTPICPPDKPACWIIPPQSIEVNAGGVSAGPGSAGGGVPVMLTPAQYRIEIPLVTPVPFPTRRPAATAEPSAQTGLTGEPSSSPTGITWQEGLVAAAAAAMGAVALHGTFTSPLGGQASGGSAGVRPSTGGATSGSPSTVLSSARAGTSAQASTLSGGSSTAARVPSGASGGEGLAYVEPTAEERRRGGGWTNGGVLSATASVTWQGDLSNPSGGGMGAATSRLNAEDMLPRASWIPGGVRSDPGSEPQPTPTPPPPTPPPPTPPAPPSAGSGASTGPTQTARDRWWEDRPARPPASAAPTPTSPFVTPVATPRAPATPAATATPSATRPAATPTPPPTATPWPRLLPMEGTSTPTPPVRTPIPSGPTPTA